MLILYDFLLLLLCCSSLPSRIIYPRMFPFYFYCWIGTHPTIEGKQVRRSWTNVVETVIGKHQPNSAEVRHTSYMLTIFFLCMANWKQKKIFRPHHRKQNSQQSQQRSIHILDDESNRYYQDAVPVPVTSGSRVDLRSENNYRSQEVNSIIKKAKERFREFQLTTRELNFRFFFLILLCVGEYFF